MNGWAHQYADDGLPTLDDVEGAASLALRDDSLLVPELHHLGRRNNKPRFSIRSMRLSRQTGSSAYEEGCRIVEGEPHSSIEIIQTG